jgi:hypothetical protein
MKLAILLALPALASAQSWIPLFDGKTLDGWKQCNGKAEYKVEGGVITGTTAEGSPNSFLCTTREYGDFILEWESKNDAVLNSGVQIRSHQYPQAVGRHPAGRVYGYQVEISKTDSANSGGIYDEARRARFLNEALSAEAAKAFRDNEWNKYRVEAVGDNIKVSINGVPVVDLIDAEDMTGFIALQVHQFKGEKPAQVRWRNIRIQDLGSHTWRPLWDGKTMNGWTVTGPARWVIENGAIHGQSVPNETAAGFVVGKESFKDLTVRWKVQINKGNSGFFVRTDPANMASYEVEIDAEKRTGGFWEVRGRNWVTGPEDNKNYKPGEWNTMAASLHGHRITFFLNGVKTVDLPNDSTGRLEGVLAMQCHTRMETDVWFKDIEVLVKQKR